MLFLVALLTAAPPECVAWAGTDAVLLSRCTRTLRMVDQKYPALSYVFRDTLRSVSPPSSDVSPQGPEEGTEHPPPPSVSIHPPVAAESNALSVVTLNVGLLHVGRYLVPRAADRRQAMMTILPDFLRLSRPLTMAIQECYLPEDRAWMTEAALQAGYEVVDQRPAENLRSGLLLLVRKDGVRRHQDGYTPFPNDAYGVAGYIRGYLWTHLFLEDGREVLVTNVHLTPLATASASWHRTLQVLSMLDLRTEAPFSCVSASEPCILVHAGDYNLAPHHRYDWAPPRPGAAGREMERWLHWDELLYSVLSNGPNEEAEGFMREGDTLDPRNPLWPESPLLVGEPNRRVDLIFVTNARVDAAHVVLREPLPQGFPVSDHYGVLLTFH